MIRSKFARRRRGIAAVEFVATTAALVGVLGAMFALAVIACAAVFRACDAVIGSMLM